MKILDRDRGRGYTNVIFTRRKSAEITGNHWKVPRITENHTTNQMILGWLLADCGLIQTTFFLLLKTHYFSWFDVIWGDLYDFENAFERWKMIWTRATFSSASSIFKLVFADFIWLTMYTRSSNRPLDLLACLPGTGTGHDFRACACPRQARPKPQTGQAGPLNRQAACRPVCNIFFF
jgi:hypothetical protein